MKQFPYYSISCGMTEREVTDMIFTRGLGRRSRLESGILMSPSLMGQLESCRRYFSKRLGSYAGAELFGRGSETPATKRSQKAVIRSQSRGAPLSRRGALLLRGPRGSRGRQAVLNMIVGQADAQRRNTLTTFTGIVSLSAR